MLKKLASLALVALLICTLCGTSAFAYALSSPDGKANSANDPPGAGSAGKAESQTNKSLKADIQKLVADAKSARGLSVTDPQNRPSQSNGLSKGAKIGIGVGIAVAVLAVIVVVTKGNSPGKVF